MKEEELEIEKGKLLEKGYIEVDFYCGLTVDEALPYLMRHLDYYKKHGFRDRDGSQIPGVYGVFNCWIFTSDMTDDDIYMMLHHKTKAEYKEEERKRIEERKARRAAYEARIPELTTEYMKLCKETPGFKAGEDKELETAVKALLSSIYETGLFPDFLRIIQLLYTFKDDKKRALSEARIEFDNQGHSGMTASITASWVRWRSEYFGEDFFYMIYPELKERDEQIEKGTLIVN